MGYTTDFSGRMAITPPLTEQQVAYLNRFSDTRRMKRDPVLADKLPDPFRAAVGLPVGIDGGYFVNGVGFAGQDHDESVLSQNSPPEGQPQLWCQWIVVSDQDGQWLEWDGGEKFYSYTDWLRYLIAHFISPWGSKLNGEIHWQGEDADDCGIIYCRDNAVDAVDSIITNPGPSWRK